MSDTTGETLNIGITAGYSSALRGLSQVLTVISRLDASVKSASRAMDTLSGTSLPRLAAAFRAVQISAGGAEASVTTFGAAAAATAAKIDLAAVATDNLGKASTASAGEVARLGTATTGTGTRMANAFTKADRTATTLFGTISRLHTLSSTPITQVVNVVRRYSSSTGGGSGGSGAAAAGGAAAASFGGRNGTGRENLREVGSTLTGMGEAELGVVGGLIAAGSKLDKVAMDAAFNANLTGDAVGKIKDQIGQIAQISDKPIEDIGAAFMRASNYGYQDADAMKLVGVANMAAVDSNASLESTTQALAQTLYQFHIPLGDSARVMNLLHSVAGATNQTLDDFVHNAGRGLQSAASLGIGLADAAVMMGLLTKAGMSASQAQTSFREIVKNVIAPTAEEEKALQKLKQTSGIDLPAAFTAAGVAHYGLTNVIEMAMKATHGNADALKDVFMGARAFIPVLHEMTDGHKDLKKTLDGALDAYKKNDLIQKQYAERTQSLQYAIANLWNRLQVMSAGFDKNVKPAFQGVLNVLNKLITAFDNLTPGQKQALVNFLTISGVLAILGGAFINIALRISSFISLLTSIGAAATTAGAGTAAAFGAGSVAFLAIAGLVTELGALAYQWYLVEQANDQATASAKSYADMQARISNQSELGALSVESLKIQDVIDGDNKELALLYHMRGNSNLRMYDTDAQEEFERIDDGSGDDSVVKKRIAVLQANRASFQGALAQENARQGDLRQEGEGGVDGILTRDTGQLGAVAKGALSHAFDSNIDEGTVATCARWLSEVYRRAGAKIPAQGIASAGGLIQWAGKQGLAHGEAQAQPGDLVAFHGPGFGARQKNGQRSENHVAIYIGNGMVRSSSDGVPKTESLASELKSGGKGASASFYTIGGAPLPSYLMGGANPKAPTDPPSKQKQRGPGVQYTPVPFKPEAEHMIYSDKDVSQADHFNRKLEDITASFAKQRYAAEANHQAWDSFSKGQNEQLAKLALAQEALKKAQSLQGTKDSGMQGRYNDAAKQVNATQALLTAAEKAREKQEKAGTKPTNSQQEHIFNLKNELAQEKGIMGERLTAVKQNGELIAAATKAAQDAQDQYSMNAQEQASRQSEIFMQSQERALKRHLITVQQYEESLRQAAAGKNTDIGANIGPEDKQRLTDAADDSQAGRERQTRQLTEQTLGMDHHNAQALRMQLEDELQAYSEAGVQQAAIDNYRAAKTKEIDAGIVQSNRQMFGDLIDAGLATANDLRAYLVTALDQMSKEFGKNSLEVAQLKMEIAKIDWQQMAQGVADYKDSLDRGKISIYDYIAYLKDLEKQMDTAGTPHTAEIFKQTNQDLIEAQSQLKQQMDQQGEEIGSSFADKLVDGMTAKGKDHKSFGQVVSEMLKDARQEWLKKQIANGVKGMIVKVEAEISNKKQHDADQHVQTTAEKVATLNNDTANKYLTSTTNFQTGVTSFGGYIQQFIDAINGSSGASGTNTNSGAGDQDQAPGSADAAHPEAANGALGKGPNAGNAGGSQSEQQAYSDIQSGAQIAQSAQSGNAAAAAQGIGGLLEKQKSQVLDYVGIGVASAAGAVASAQAGDDMGAAQSVLGGLSMIPGPVGAVATGLSAALMVASLFGPKKAYAPTHIYDETYAPILSDFGSTIDSGYSGSSGMRSLMATTSMGAAGVRGIGSPGTASGGAGSGSANAGTGSAIHINSPLIGALHLPNVVDTDSFVQEAGPKLMDMLSQRLAFSDHSYSGSSS